MSTLASAWSLDHFGHAVRDLEQSIEFYRRAFGFQVESRETLQEQAVELCFLQLPNTLIELIAPLPGNSTLEKFLERRGEGLHHVCYRVDSVDAELARLESQGMKLIDRTSRPGSRNMRIAFVHPSDTHGVLIELCSEAA